MNTGSTSTPFNLKAVIKGKKLKIYQSEITQTRLSGKSQYSIVETVKGALTFLQSSIRA